MSQETDAFLKLLPDAKFSLMLEWNPHKPDHLTIEDWEKLFEFPGDWVSDEQRDKAIAQDNLWLLRWYPDNSVGSYCCLACDLDVLL